VSLLLDTHAWLWWLGDRPMTAVARERIADPAVTVSVSAATVWEIAIKRALAKVSLSGSIVSHVRDGGFDLLSISGDHAERAGALPDHHRDPFDRLLIAQAQAEGLTVVTRDPRFADYDVAVLAC
jgi:PIN domain nuclease of toxin-antitoxin system